MKKGFNRMMTTLLENCSISPPSGTVSEVYLPLTFFDIPWVNIHPIQGLVFYEFPCSTTHFSDTLVPNLKQSLSLALKHYVSLAGNLPYPLNSSEEKPKLRYLAGDAVSLAVVESTKDFDFLVANHARDADEFYDFIPQLSPIREETDYMIGPVLALQVTLFPGRGVCFGMANHHSVGDASSTVAFFKAWAAINKLGGDDDDEFLGPHLPLLDKSAIKDPRGIDSIFWNARKHIPFKSPTFPLPTGRVLATYVLNQDHVRKLKGLVLSKNPGLVQVSTFAVATAYVWTCFVKSGEQVEDDEFFFFAVNCRARIDPLLPANYFGNCTSYGKAIIENQKLVGAEGFVLAATRIAEDIKNRVNHKDEVLKRAETLISDLDEVTGKRIVGVSGSPKFDLYTADFGWGKPKKLEVVHIDGEQYAMSLSRSRDSEGGLEVGLSLPKERMQKISIIFNDGLKF